MISWSTQRKITYASIGVALALLLVVVPLFFFFYKTPSCFDGSKNGDETGVDCGGSCQLLCSFETIDPVVVWSRAFKITPGIYSAVAYIENPNINSQATVGYEFKLYDKNNTLIGTRNGRGFLPKNKVFAIFEPNISTGTSTPARVTFQFTEKPVWSRNLMPAPDIAVTEKRLTSELIKPRIDATIENRSDTPQGKIETVAIVYDDKENAIGASRTFVDSLEPRQSADVVFTWPAAFQGTETMCRVENTDVVIGERSEAIGVVLALDRSGSMQSEGKKPPQPLTAVKSAAVAFLNQLRGSDRVGLVSFADTASEPVDASLTSDYKAVEEAINTISIGAKGTQYTNLGDAIEKASADLISPNSSDLTRRVVVLLTDGIATKPEKAGDPLYPSTYALEQATLAKQRGVELYIVGLGKDVNAELLRNMATTPEHYFSAASTKDLATIYNRIALQICKNQVAVIEVIPRVIPNTVR